MVLASESREVWSLTSASALALLLLVLTIAPEVLLSLLDWTLIFSVEFLAD
jgi:hypothetical protein